MWYNDATETEAGSPGKLETQTEKENTTMTIRYDELKKNDVILFHGANVIITEITETPAPANEWYPNEKSITFTIKPADDEAIKTLGKFYAHGTYGGVGCLTTTLISR